MAQYLAGAPFCEARVVTKEADSADRFNELDEESADIYVLLSSYKPEVQQVATVMLWCRCAPTIRTALGRRSYCLDAHHA
jgi:hypothetical protein